MPVGQVHCANHWDPGDLLDDDICHSRAYSEKHRAATQISQRYPVAALEYANIRGDAHVFRREKATGAFSFSCQSTAQEVWYCKAATARCVCQSQYAEHCVHFETVSAVCRIAR